MNCLAGGSRPPQRPRASEGRRAVGEAGRQGRGMGRRRVCVGGSGGAAAAARVDSLRRRSGGGVRAGRARRSDGGAAAAGALMAAAGALMAAAAQSMGGSSLSWRRGLPPKVRAGLPFRPTPGPGVGDRSAGRGRRDGRIGYHRPGPSGLWGRVQALLGAEPVGRAALDRTVRVQGEGSAQASKAVGREVGWGGGPPRP